MSVFNKVAATIVSAAFVLSFATVSAASALTVSCGGVPSSTSIAWTASSLGGVAPVAFLWGNGNTSASQVVAVSPGTYLMAIQGTDASSTVATSTCSATVAQLAPTITSFVATPASITSGQSSALSWTVTGASSTVIDNGIGVVTGTSVTVTPTVTTTYHLSAMNSGGTTNASATVTVTVPSTGGNDVATQIQNLLNQIAALKTQIMSLIQQQAAGGTGGTDGTVATSTPAACNFGRDLQQGDEGDDVKQLQRTLSSDPTIFPPRLVTGFFGSHTQQALKKFQQKFGIASTSTGFFGPKTRGYLKQHCGEQERQGLENSMSTSTSIWSSANGDNGNGGEQGNDGGNGKNGGRGGRGN